ncbi:MAG: hypothetical protein ACI8WB_006126 [Phenylobacterium sp.]|jgi:hypothetical protein
MNILLDSERKGPKLVDELNHANEGEVVSPTL